MHPGRERNVLRWDVYHARLRGRLAEVDEALTALGEPRGPRDRERLESLRRQRDDLERQLRQLGPSPSAKMG